MHEDEVWRAKKSESVGVRQCLTYKVQSPFNCGNRAKGGLWYKWEGAKYHPLMELDGFTPMYGD